MTDPAGRPLLPPPSGGAMPLSTPSPPPPPPGPPQRLELDDLLDQLHDDLDLERQSAPSDPRTPLSNPLDVARPALAEAAVIESTGGAAFDPVFASLTHRLAGWLIDTLVMLLLMVPGIAVLIAGGSTATTILGVALLVAGFVLSTYLYARSVARSGQWIGNRVTSTRVVDVVNGSYIPSNRGATRFVIRQLVSTIFFIGFLMALGDSQRRAFHDKFASTVVVRPPHATWSIDDEQQT